ncbi:hypothetical protein TNCV_168941 [Trichonephila clavipes]|nr:hypothetical protein TNCV_168941 [Trichonephila clavipes]
MCVCDASHHNQASEIDGALLLKPFAHVCLMEHYCFGVILSVDTRRWRSHNDEEDDPKCLLRCGRRTKRLAQLKDLKSFHVVTIPVHSLRAWDGHPGAWGLDKLDLSRFYGYKFRSSSACKCADAC